MADPPTPSISGPERIAADGVSLSVHEWRGSGPPWLHVHHADDEAWHVLEGTITFRFADRTVEAAAGSTVFVPAGAAHTYAASGDARYLMILTPRLRALIAELQNSPPAEHAGIMRRHDSEILE
jgi:uncharacterized RmlC-like cupin family protein